MKIILNSDILHHQSLVIDSLSKNLQELFRVCAKKGHVIVIPETTLLEFNRHQSQESQKLISQLENAYNLLDKLNITYNRVEPSQVIKKSDIVSLIQKYGVKIVVEEPTHDDLKKAHMRACLHECPHPPDTKSDEMRDLVIWMIALRLSSRDGGALLISRDEVHVHTRGDDEAKLASLARVKSIEEALEYFDVETPAGRLIKQFLEPVWNDLVEAGLPCDSQLYIGGLTQARFIQGIQGPKFASCTLKSKTSDGKPIKAATEIHINNNLINKVTLSDILVENKPWKEPQLSITPNKTFVAEQDDYKERIDALRAIIGE